MFDKEIEAIAKCTELIKDLDEDAKMRVIKYLIERFSIGNNPINNMGNTSQQIPKGQFLNTSQETNFLDAETVDYPTLKQLVIKNYPKNEAEWILCYAFLASKYGTETFKKDDVIEGYKESNRYTENNSKNLSNTFNSCIKKDWIKDFNKDEFILKSEGISYAKEVLNGNSISKEIKRIKKSKPTTGKSSD